MMKHNKLRVFNVVVILIVVLTSIQLYSQTKTKTIRGIIVNEFDERMNDVEVSALKSKNITTSSCNGRFKIDIAENDTLVFKKDHYFLKKVAFKRNYNIYLLHLDYASARKELKENMKYHDSVATCQPLYVINGSVECNYIDQTEKYEYLEEKDLKKFILKGIDATKRFGPYAKNGAIWIYVKCNVSS
tara:strand:- start:1 stop:564 length:564 start_codon:yes stop_codon:yes gene_type:complete